MLQGDFPIPNDTILDALEGVMEEIKICRWCQKQYDVSLAVTGDKTICHNCWLESEIRKPKGQIWVGVRSLDHLRSKAASKTSGSITVSIEILNTVANEVKDLIHRIKEEKRNV